MADLIERLRAAAMGFDWSDLPDDAPIPAVPLLREAATALSQEREAREKADAQIAYWQGRSSEAIGRAYAAEALAEVPDEADIYDQAATLAIPAARTGCSYFDGIEAYRKQLSLKATAIRRAAALSSSKQKDGE